ncbi:unnamed protein product, partial [marine sediment metagenome]
ERVQAAFYSRRDTARLMGVAESTVRLWEAELGSALYRPAVCRGRFRQYHAYQIELMQAERMGSMPLEEAELRWELFRTGLGRDTAPTHHLQTQIHADERR